MINAVIFTVHLIFALVVYTKKWQDESVSMALLNVGLIGILFSVGWGITTMIAKSLMEAEGFGVQFDRDTFALSLLSIAEYFFYKMYYRDLFTEDDTEKQ